MEKPDKLFGRLGNRMFQCAFYWSWAMDNNGGDFYFQDEKWFEKHKEDIRALFSKGITSQPYISICVRRGDAVMPPDSEWRTNLAEDTDYYERAIERFKGHQFLIFSDDITWCEQKFKGPQFHYCYETDPVEALNLMAGCYGHIIANSTFSWWGAYLSHDPRAIVIAPREETWWKNIEKFKPFPVKLPANWIQI